MSVAINVSRPIPLTTLLIASIAHRLQSVNQDPARCEIGSRAKSDDRQHSDRRSRIGRQLKNSSHSFSFSHFSDDGVNRHAREYALVAAMIDISARVAETRCGEI
jgi:hypothetical protein